MKLIFCEMFIDKADAVRREKYFKTSKGKSSLQQIIRGSINLIGGQVAELVDARDLKSREGKTS